MYQMTPQATALPGGWNADGRTLRRDLRPVFWIGAIVAAVFFLGFGGWAAVAPLASAAIAPGVVNPDGNRKTVQHLEGGIIREIRVRDGDTVRPGDVLLVLEDTQARAAYDLLQTQFDALAARHARLVAEQTGADRPAFPAELRRRAAQLPAIASLVDGQRQLFELRRQTLDERKAILDQKIAQLGEEIRGVRAVIKARGRELALIEDEIEQVARLLARGYERKPRLLALQRREALIDGERAGLFAGIARAEQAINEARLERVNLETTRRDQVAGEVNQTRADMLAMQKRLLASRDVLRRTEVVAPVGGRIVQSRFHTVGGVVGAGKPILDIVPTQDQLVVDARISPLDIDVVGPGLPAEVHLLAYRQRNLPRVLGTVRQVSADALQDAETGQRYFLARVEVDPAELQRLPGKVGLAAGMPAEVLIKTGERTMLNYLIDPFLVSIRRTFHED